MEVIIKGRHMEVTDALRRYSEDKVARLNKYLDKIMKIEIEFIVDNNPSVPNSQTAEVTLHSKGPIIRGKVSTENMYASVDGVVDRLERQIKKHKGKINHAHRHGTGLGEFAVQHSEEGSAESGEPASKLVKTKRVSLKPMTTEEATLQMDLLGHDFFVFTNSDTDEVNVVYRRRDNNYGLIEPIFGKG